MTSLRDFLMDHALALIVCAMGVVLIVRLVSRSRPLSLFDFGWQSAGFLLLLGLGGLFLDPEVSGWLVLGSLGFLAAALAWLAASAQWSVPLGAVAGAVLAVALGGWALTPIQAGLSESINAIQSFEILQPWWLLLLLLLPLIVWMSYRSLAGLGPQRRRIAIGLRCLIILLLSLALAELRLTRPTENVTVLFIVDRSLSVPQEIDPNAVTADGSRVDRSWQRIQEFINDSVLNRAQRNDQAGAILFARTPRLVLSPKPVDKLIVNDRWAGAIDANYTDIAAALKLGLASFPEGTGKRIVLVSDGNENLGDAREQALIVRQNGVQIDTVLLATAERNDHEVLVESVEAPPVTAEGERLPPIRVLVRNAHPSEYVLGTLELFRSQETGERSLPIIASPNVIEPERVPPVVSLRPGLNPFSFRDDTPRAQAGQETRSYTYRAVFQPLGAVSEAILRQGTVAGGREKQGTVAGGNGEPDLTQLTTDRLQNNRARTHVITRGQRRVLLVESSPPAAGGWTHQHLLDQLRAAKFTVVPVSVGTLPEDAGALGVFLSNFDCVILANVPAELLTNDQQEMIRSNTFDQGCGLIMVGGPDSFGAGGYQDTPIERALPVDCEIKSLQALGKGGLVLIMHASEMADGNRWQKEIAKLAIKKLGPIDMVGLIDYNFNTRWHIPFQEIGLDQSPLLAKVDRMTPGDMPDFDPGLQMALAELSDPAHNLATRHVIIISDGDPSLGPAGLAALANMKRANITCTTVGVAYHVPGAEERMKSVAIPSGAYFHVTDPRQLPAIYIREARRVSQSFLYDKRFSPKLLASGRFSGGPTANLEAPLPDLFGFIRTTLKPSPLASMLIEGPNVFDQRFPILAVWQYGLGRSAAFTSDARTVPPNQLYWDRLWAGSDMYRKHWEQLVNWSLRGLETGWLNMTTEYRDGRVLVTVRARDENNRPLTDLKIEGGVTTPGGQEGNQSPSRLRFVQVSGGVYEAEFEAEEAGSYFVNATASRGGQPIDSVRSGLSVSYSPEFAFSDLSSDAALMAELSEITGGQVYNARFDDLNELARSGELFRESAPVVWSRQPVWYWLIFFAGVTLVFDVGVRRISIEWAEVRRGLSTGWMYLRHREERAESEETYFTRLKRRKAEATEGFDRATAGRRFQPESAPTGEAPPGADDVPVAPPTPTSPSAPREELAPTSEEPDDYFAKLKRAKRRARQQPPEENE